MKRPRTIAIALLLALAAVLSACASKGHDAGSGDIAGQYALVSVDGIPIPANVTHEGVDLEVQSGTFTINADGTCVSRTSFVPPTGTEVTRDVSATYTRDGSQLTMNWEGAGTTVGIVEGDTFTMDNEGMEFVYRK